MAKTVACPCGAQIQVPEEEHLTVRCPTCGLEVAIPPGEPTAPEVPAPQEQVSALVGPSPSAGSLLEQAPAVQPLPPPDLVLPNESEIRAPAIAVEPDPALNFIDPNERPRPMYPLYPPAAVVVATLLGGVLGGCIVLAYNYGALGKLGAASRSAAVGIIVAAAFLLFILVFPTPEAAGVSSLLWALLFACMAPLWLAGAFSFALLHRVLLLLPPAAMFGIAHFLQAGLFARHRERSGKTGSAWGAAGIGLGCSFLMFVGLAFYSAGFYLGRDRTSEVEIVHETGRRDMVYYHDGVSRVEALQLGLLLKALGYFDGKGGNKIHLGKSGDTYVVSFLFKDDVWDRPEAVAMIEPLLGSFSRDVFDGKPVEIRLCDQYLDTHKTIK